MSGLLGLTQSINDRQSATQELAVLERLEGRQQQEQQQEMSAQIMQEQMYQQMYQQADGLLGKDRKRINDQIKAAQSQVQSALDKWGGSKQQFLANGGVSLLGKMNSDILHSEQAERYKTNKENLARIMEIQEKGLGHLLSPNDVKSVEDYHANEDGATIKYSGMMTEVEIPHDKFAAGEEIHPYYIMNHNANLVKIMGNYAKVYPDRPEPETDENGQLTVTGRSQVMAFMKKMGYGGMGQNSALMQKKMAQQKAAAEAKAVEEKRTTLGVLNELPHMVGKVTADQITPQYMNELMNKDGNDAFRDMFAGDFKAMSRRRSAAGSTWDGVGEVLDYFGQDKVALRGSKRLAIGQGDINKLATEVLGIAPEGNKISGYSIDNEWFASDGTKVSSNERDVDAADYGKEFKILGLVTAFESAVEDGKSGASKDILLVDAYDDDGTFDAKSTKKFYENQYGDQANTEARMGYYMAVEGADGDILYKKVDIEKTSVRSSLNEAYGKANDISDEVGEAKQYDKARNDYQKMTQEQKYELEQYKSETRPVFEDPMFKQEGEQFYGAGSAGQMNRNDMMKSFYMAYENVLSKQAGLDPKKSTERLHKQVYNDTFTNFMKTAGVVEDLKDHSKSPDEIIQKFMENINKTVEPGSFNEQAYSQIAQKWKQILQNL